MSVEPSQPLPTVESKSDLVAALVSANARLRSVLETLTESQERWHEERAWLHAMIDQVPDYLFVKDREGRFVVANRAIANDLGKADARALIGRTDLDMHPPEIARMFHATDTAVMRSGQPMLDIEEFVIRPDGSRRWLSTSKQPLRGPDGSILGLVGIARDITDRKRAEDRIHFLAYHDALTGLPNRTQFELALASAGGTAALILIDLDRFKHVNDTLGHVAGDELIRQVADRLRPLAGGAGIVSRLGGDEFAVLLAAPAGTAEAEALCIEILRVINLPFDLFGDPAFVGASLGLSRWRTGASADQLLREADIALYEAKARGRGGWQTFADTMAVGLEQRRHIEQELRKALAEGGQLAVEYQPIFSIDATTLLGAEALVRWDHPSMGRLAPETFVATAEERGLIERIGEWVLIEACGVLARTHVPWIAVNVSPVELRSDHYCERVLETLRRYRLAPARLQLEITEGVLLDGADAADSGLRRLREAGVRLALDDFGTGYSSLNYLRRYNVDKIKVDRSFVARIGSSAAADVIVRTIVGLALGLQMRVTAEGVETEAQRAFLSDCGVDELQGFLLSRPLPLQALRRLI